MNDRTQWPPYGAYCTTCDRPITQHYPATLPMRTYIRCHNCGHVTPAYRNETPEKIQQNRESGKQNNSTV